jgi:ParB-like chromosome segregation protein Spo0J
MTGTTRAAPAKAWPADKIERWPVDDIVPYERNARVHSPEQIEQIARSIREFGFTMPILVAEGGTIIAGHGRLEAAKKLGLDEVPVMIARGWTDEQRRAYTIADNRIGEASSWDDDLLRVELGSLASAEFDLNALGFSDKELAAVLGGWSPDVEHVAARGAHTQGITVTIKVAVTQEDGARARECIERALHSAGIGFEL